MKRRWPTEEEDPLWSFSYEDEISHDNEEDDDDEKGPDLCIFCNGLGEDALERMCKYCGGKGER